MARGRKNIEGQLSFDFCLDSRNYVCQANKLIGGKQALKLNSAKLIRAAIMQIVKGDEDLNLYTITIKELASLLNVPESNIYRDIEDITNDIICNPVYVREEHGKKIRWIKIPWVTRCEYNSDVGVALKLNDELKPFLLSLRKNYTQYTLDSVLSMKSTYAIRMYELILSRIMTKKIPLEGIEIKIMIDEIRECCDCEGKSYDILSNLRNRVIDISMREINDKTPFEVSYKYIKKGKLVIGFEFNLNMKYHIALL